MFLKKSLLPLLLALLLVFPWLIFAKSGKTTIAQGDRPAYTVFIKSSGKINIKSYGTGIESSYKQGEEKSKKSDEPKKKKKKKKKSGDEDGEGEGESSGESSSEGGGDGGPRNVAQLSFAAGHGWGVDRLSFSVEEDGSIDIALKNEKKMPLRKKKGKKKGGSKAKASKKDKQLAKEQERKEKDKENDDSFESACDFRDIKINDDVLQKDVVHVDGDEHVVKFDAKKGQVYRLSITARQGVPNTNSGLSSNE